MNNVTFKDYYQILCIDINATEADVKKSFRSLALHLHPDRNKAADAHSKFVDVNEAYQILSDPDKRAKYNSLYKYYTSTKGNKRPGRANWEDLAEWSEQGRAVGQKYAEYTFSDFARDAYVDCATNVLIETIFDSLGNIIEVAGDALGDVLDSD